jgi:hypothetical protein
MSITRTGVFAVLAASFLLASCASTSSSPPKTAAVASPEPPRSPTAEFDWSNAPGTNKLTGTVAYAPDRRSHWSCRNESVVLMPDTPTTRARVTALYGSTSFAVRPVEEVKTKSASLGDVSFTSFIKHTDCDASGNFGFDGLPDGSWFLVARANRAHSRSSSVDDAVAILQRVTLSGGRETHVKVPAF